MTGRTKPYDDAPERRWRIARRVLWSAIWAILGAVAWRVYGETGSLWQGFGVVAGAVLMYAHALAATFLCAGVGVGLGGLRWRG